MYRTRETWEGKDPEAMISKVTLRIEVGGGSAVEVVA